MLLFIIIKVAIVYSNTMLKWIDIFILHAMQIYLLFCISIRMTKLGIKFTENWKYDFQNLIFDSKSQKSPELL